MITTPPAEPIDPADETAAIDRIVRSGPQGAIAVAGMSVVILLALWLAFYFLVFMPRSPV
jgi:hypothetical protein